MNCLPRSQAQTKSNEKQNDKEEVREMDETDQI